METMLYIRAELTQIHFMNSSQISDYVGEDMFTKMLNSVFSVYIKYLSINRLLSI